MHELAICQALLTQVEQLAAAQGAQSVARIRLRVGPLSGVEPDQLLDVFGIARRGAAADAELCIERSGVRVRCLECDAESSTAPNRLLCARCGGFRTRLLAGDELLLERLEFRQPPAGAGCAAHAIPETSAHV